MTFTWLKSFQAMGSPQSTPIDTGPPLTALPLTPGSRWGEPQPARWRWAVDASLWQPPDLSESAEFQLLLGLVPHTLYWKVLDGA